MNSPALGPPLVEPYFDDLKMEQDFIQKLLEVQVDMSEQEQKHLKDTVTARLNTCQVQFELKKLKHERRLKNDVRSRKDKFAAKKEATFLNASSNSAKKVLKLKQEERNIETTHRKVIKGSKKKLATILQSTISNLERLLQQQSERIRRAQETNVNLASKQERAVNVLKSKLLEKISNSSATDQVTGERLLQEYHINLQVLDEEIHKSKMHQEQVLQQKIQSRKLEKMEESKQAMKEHSRTSPYRVGSAKRFAADCLVSLLMDVRHKQDLKQLEDYNVKHGEKLKSLLERRYYINSKLALQLHEREMIIKLASALNMSRTDLEEELKNSMSAEIQGEEGSEAGLLLTTSVLNLFDTELHP